MENGRRRISGTASQIVMWEPVVGGLFPDMRPGLIVSIMAVGFGNLMLFQLIALPVEFNATAPAKRLIVQTGAVAPSPEKDDMNRVLSAATMTCLAAFVSSLAHSLVYVLRMLGDRR